MKITEKEFNALTGQETSTERDETKAEITEREAFDAQVTQLQEEVKKKTIARAALLEKLGITADEAALLLS